MPSLYSYCSLFCLFHIADALSRPSFCLLFSLTLEDFSFPFLSFPLLTNRFLVTGYFTRFFILLPWGGKNISGRFCPTTSLFFCVSFFSHPTWFYLFFISLLISSFVCRQPISFFPSFIPPRVIYIVTLYLCVVVLGFSISFVFFVAFCITSSFFFLFCVSSTSLCCARSSKKNKIKNSRQISVAKLN